jgi:peptidoglycan hydrolase-like protein with peptidoglycan-binding domain
MKQWRNMSTVMGVGRPAWPAHKVVAEPAVATTPVVAPIEPAPVVPVVAVATPAPVSNKPELTAALKVGSKGAQVKYLQKALHIPADGIFGPATKAAVIKFQKKNAIKPTGTVGKETWSKIA